MMERIPDTDSASTPECFVSLQILGQLECHPGTFTEIKIEPEERRAERTDAECIPRAIQMLVGEDMVTVVKQEPSECDSDENEPVLPLKRAPDSNDHAAIANKQLLRKSTRIASKIACGHCFKGFSSPDLMLEHTRKAHGNRSKGDPKSADDDPKQWNHPPPQKPAKESDANSSFEEDYTAEFICKICEAAFDKQSELNTHFRKCFKKQNRKREPVKTKNFLENRNKKAKEDTGTSMKVYMCPVTDCKFQNKAKRNIQSHLLIHANTLPADQLSRFTAADGIPSQYINAETSKARDDNPRKRKQRPAQREAYCVQCDQKFAGLWGSTRLKEHNREFHEEYAELFQCPVEECPYFNIRAQRIRSHIMVKHAKHLAPEQIQSLIRPEASSKKRVPNPRFRGLLAKSSTEDPSPRLMRTGRSISCETCDKKFYGNSCKANLVRHQREYHGDTSRYECPFVGCDFTVRRQHKLRHHIQHYDHGELAQQGNRRPSEFIKEEEQMNDMSQ